VRAVREALPDADLTVDANSAYRLVDARRCGGSTTSTSPTSSSRSPTTTWSTTPSCSASCARDLPRRVDPLRRGRPQGLQIGAGRIINVKVGRVRGYVQAKRLHDVAVAFGAPVWCGGMLESGVGRAHNLHLSSLEGFVLPGDTASASRYWDEDIVEPLLDAVDGVQQVPRAPASA
jgi:o-succinylbenzoate synthase